MWSLLLACSSPGQPGSLLLARQPQDLTRLVLPETNRPAPPNERVPLNGPWEEIRREDGRIEWSHDLPFRSVNYWDAGRQKPVGMVLRTGDQKQTFKELGETVHAQGTWSYRSGHVVVVADAEPSGLTLSWPQADREERSLNRDTAELEPQDFALRSLSLHRTTGFGVYLPAPAEATFRVTVPKDGQFSTQLRLLRPAVADGPTSDGATVRVHVDGQEVATHRFEGPDVLPLKADLSDWSGQSVELTLATDPGGTTTADYVFFGEPALYTPQRRPQRLVVVFIDTLRRDHLGLYGYERDTSPRLDRLADEGLVFDQARAPAPWTLPSGRAALTGRHPHRFEEGQHLGTWLGPHGIPTAAVVGNMYLTRSFGLADGWSRHRGSAGTAAATITDRAIDALKAHADQPLALVVHYMDPHLPYNEPPEHRLWADAPPEGLKPGFMERDLNGWLEQNPEGLEYVHARYDQNIRTVDAEIGRLLDFAGSNTTTVVFSDHGEEFFEHGHVGHGRGLSEEVLRVPLMLHGPGIEPGRSELPATLQDVVPTAMAALGLPLPEGLDGVDLRGEVPMDRPIAMGTPLFGESGLGVVHNQKKWQLMGVTEQVYDLVIDPTEDQPLGVDTAPFHRAFEHADGRPLLRVLRVAVKTLNGPQLRRGQTVVLSGAIDALWPRPGGSYDFTVPPIRDQKLVMRTGSPSELFLQTDGVDLLEGNAELTWTLRPAEPRAESGRLSDTVQEQLRQLGYVE